jgi:hypothetical protein
VLFGGRAGFEVWTSGRHGTLPDDDLPPYGFLDAADGHHFDGRLEFLDTQGGRAHAGIRHQSGPHSAPQLSTESSACGERERSKHGQIPADSPARTGRAGVDT